MNKWVGWSLAVVAITLGYVQYGWQGAILGITIVTFWLVLQFNRAMRVMRLAAQSPVGYVDSAVMLNAKLGRGMRLMEIVPLTRSLGRKLSASPEVFEWKDNSGASVEVVLDDGRCVRWALKRPPTDQALP